MRLFAMSQAIRQFFAKVHVLSKQNKSHIPQTRHRTRALTKQCVPRCSYFLMLFNPKLIAKQGQKILPLVNVRTKLRTIR